MIKMIEKVNEDENTNEMEKIIDSDMAKHKNEEHRDANLDDVTEEGSNLCAIQYMCCAVHTLQHAIRNGLKDTHSRNLIGKT